MTPNWFAQTLRTLQMDQNGTHRPRRRSAGVLLESLEPRLSLSSLPAVTPRSWDLNPQPLPPGFMVEVGAMPQPGIVGSHIGMNIVGNHIGASAIQGNHIG
jgi:hypothetical protein